MIETQQIILKAILFIIEEEVIQLRIAAPSRIKSCFHLCNLFLKLFKELQIPSTLNHELVDLLIKWWQHAVADFSHYAVEGHNLIQQLHWWELRQVCQRAFNIRVDIRSGKYLQLLWFEQIWTSHKLLVEHVEIKTSGFDKFGIRIACAPFWRHRWHIQTWVPLGQGLSQKIELFIPSLYFVFADAVFTVNVVYYMVSILAFPWVTNAKMLSKVIWGKRLVYA